MKKHVLFIDDDEVFHFLNSKIISLSGVECTIGKALNGLQALNQIYELIDQNQSLPDYIFVDLDMPVMNGFEFIKKFQGLDYERRSKTEIIILTSSGSGTDKEHAAALGVNYFISKPLSEETVKTLFTKQA